MNISELIKELDKIKNEHGDIDVYVLEYGSSNYIPLKQFMILKDTATYGAFGPVEKTGLMLS